MGLSKIKPERWITTELACTNGTTFDPLMPGSMAYISEGCDLLDIGCASGKQTFKAEELGVTVTGIDCWTGTLYSRKSCRRRFFSLLPAGWETRHLIG